MVFTLKQGDRPLEGYTIQRGVGRGGFGEVYHALSDGGKEVALKYLRDNPQVELRGVAHCLNLKNPHLVTIYDIKQNKAGEWFVVMEYVNGPSLRDLMIDAPRGLGVQKAAYFLREIGRGLAYLHDHGIVHRDMKPGNIFYE
ncbi:MAG: protein kinase, partial [Phycisphaerae bacterium]|nr:protein kinase [Phycisphaerae bacterium]